jgi:hypothetical protein
VGTAARDLVLKPAIIAELLKDSVLGSFDAEELAAMTFVKASSEALEIPFTWGAQPEEQAAPEQQQQQEEAAITEPHVLPADLEKGARHGLQALRGSSMAPAWPHAGADCTPMWLAAGVTVAMEPHSDPVAMEMPSIEMEPHSDPVAMEMPSIEMEPHSDPVAMEMPSIKMEPQVGWSSCLVPLSWPGQRPGQRAVAATEQAGRCH